ncbi:MAG: hypothetical protein JOZ69_13660 [Myxococcales bacterium]|nr:hypothetical protein [Myxococcales bacterium]
MMLTSAIARLREAAYHAITSPWGDALAPVRVPKDLARRLNVALGRPLAPRDELASRDRARARLAELRTSRATGAAAAPSASPGPAPILVYFEKDRNVRELQRIEELLAAKGLAWKRLDVGGDDATIDFVLRKAGCERDQLPVVFVADRALGRHADLVRADAAGELDAALRG